MRRTPASQRTEPIGTDSFLDIVANLVGILVILVMVIGVRTRDAWESAQAETAARPVAKAGSRDAPEPLPDVASARAVVDGLQSSILGVQRESTELEQEIQTHRLQRDRLLLSLTQAERALQQRRGELDQQQQAQLQLDVQLQQARRQLKTLHSRQNSILADQARPQQIEHVATPLAQAVFAQEEHFRLLGGRLVYVPLNRLTSQLKAEAPRKLWKLKGTSRIVETIGPQDGFLLKYTLRRGQYAMDTPSGPAVQEVVELDHFVMIPAGADLGEPLPDALQPGSQFRRRLQAWVPNETIITVWTYPDSYAEFRGLKDQLLELGYLTAARPLPAGQLISGSPQGTRSAAQ
jgi:hypothetical protein